MRKPNLPVPSDSVNAAGPPPALLCHHTSELGHFSTTEHTADLGVGCFSRQEKSLVYLYIIHSIPSNKVGDNTMPSASSNYFCHLRLKIVLIFSREMT